MNRSQKIYISFLTANALLWLAFGALIYYFVSVALAGALVSDWLYLWIGITATIAGCFGYLTHLIFQRLGV